MINILIKNNIIKFNKYNIIKFSCIKYNIIYCKILLYSYICIYECILIRIWNAKAQECERKCYYSPTVISTHISNDERFTEMKFMTCYTSRNTTKDYAKKKVK